MWKTSRDTQNCANVQYAFAFYFILHERFTFGLAAHITYKNTCSIAKNYFDCLLVVKSGHARYPILTVLTRWKYVIMGARRNISRGGKTTNTLKNGHVFGALCKKSTIFGAPKALTKNVAFFAAF